METPVFDEMYPSGVVYTAAMAGRVRALKDEHEALKAEVVRLRAHGDGRAGGFETPDLDQILADFPEALDQPAYMNADWDRAKEQYASLRSAIERLREENAVLRTGGFICPDCGYGVSADEDGCCASCGADTDTLDRLRAKAALCDEIMAAFRGGGGYPLRPYDAIWLNRYSAITERKEEG